MSTLYKAKMPKYFFSHHKIIRCANLIEMRVLFGLLGYFDYVDMGGRGEFLNLIMLDDIGGGGALEDPYF